MAETPLPHRRMPTTASSKSPRPWPRWLKITGWSILGVLGATLLVFLATVMFGGVHGTEFCPQTFERRSYSFYELPILHIQMTGERNDDLTGDTEKCITTNKFIPTPTSPKKDWHVLVGSRGTRLRRPGDAGILLQYLDAEESSNVYRWVAWSDKNNELAKVLWPAVQRLAIREMYVFLPEVFDLAKTATDPKKFQADLDQFIAGKLLLLGRGLTEQKDAPGAVSALDEALALDPENAEIQKAHAAAKALEAEKAE
jgi:hypothetical protein